MFLLAIVPAVLLFCGMFKCPESPRWLVKQGRIAEAEAASRLLWGKENKFEETIGELHSSTSEEDASWGELLSKRYRKVVSVGASLFFIQQFSGINAVVFFSTAVFRGAGIKSDVAASALVALSNVIGSIVASSQMDKKGRKNLLITSFAGMAVAMLVLATSLAWQALKTISAILAVLAAVSYMLAFSYGVGPIPALLLAEMFASRIRAKAMAVSLGVHWVCNFVIGLLFLSVVEKVGVSVVYLVFGAVCLCGILYVSKNVVETKGRSLEEIERELTPVVYDDNDAAVFI
jgi:sugar porter (SP) family MFS transporter